MWLSMITATSPWLGSYRLNTTHSPGPPLGFEDVSMSSVCQCICVCVCLHVCICVCVCLCLCLCLFVPACLCVCVRVSLSVALSACMPVCVYVCVCVHACVCVCLLRCVHRLWGLACYHKWQRNLKGSQWIGSLILYSFGGDVILKTI